MWSSEDIHCFIRAVIPNYATSNKKGLILLNIILTVGDYTAHDIVAYGFLFQNLKNARWWQCGKFLGVIC